MSNFVPHSDCIQATIAVMCDKWTPLLLYELSRGQQTFSSLERSLAGISPRTLSQRLQKLETEQIIIKQCYCDHPPRYAYTLTTKGAELQTILRNMIEWGAKYSNCSSTEVDRLA